MRGTIIPSAVIIVARNRIRRTILILAVSILPLLALSCNGTPTPYATHTPLPNPSQTATSESPTRPLPPVPPGFPTPSGETPIWPTCTAFPEPSALAVAIQDACLAANGQPIILDRDGPLWRQARQMYEGCPLSPEVTVEHQGVVYHAQRYLFGYLWYEDGQPERIWYMTHLGWDIHEAGACVNYTRGLPMVVR